MTRGSRYIFLGPRSLCLSRPYLMWISRVLSEETDLWPSPWQAVQMGNDLNLSILTRDLNIELDLSKNVKSYKAGAFHFIDGQFPPSFLVDSHYESVFSWVGFNNGRRYRSCSLPLRLLQSRGTFSEQVSSWTKISTTNWERSTDTHRQPGTSIRWLGSTIRSIFLLYLNLCRLTQNTGDVVHIKILGQPMVILNSLQASRDLLDKRSSIYSDRPRFVLLAELCVPSDFFTIAP